MCHTAAILDAAHGNVQRPAHNLVAVPFTEPLFALHTSLEYYATIRDVTALVIAPI